MKRTMIGGQAVMEGVMMRNGHDYAVAVRKPDKEIEIKTGHTQSFADKHAWAKVPIIRGVVAFVESLVVGMKTLTYSASFFEEEEEPGKFEKWLMDKLGDKAEKVVIGFAVALSIVLAIGIFMLLPFGISQLLKGVITSYSVRTLLEGVIRVLIFLAYIVAISRMEDIKRTFMYHGAEHKTINCLEAGDPLTPENVEKHSRLHKRCGTSFLLIVMIISIVVFMFIRFENVWLKLLFRLLLVPVIAGISYEFIKFAGRNDSKLVCALSKPGMSLQYLTTKEPTRDMMEVAIASVEAVFDWEAYQEAMRNGEIED